MIHTIEDLYAGAGSIVTAFNAFAVAHGLQKTTKADHVCYKCDSNETFERIRALLEPAAVFIFQSYISNRRIAYIRLLKPIETVLGPIYFVELSDQKPDGSQVNDFDHIEIYPREVGIEEVTATLEAQGVILEKKVRPHHTTIEMKIEGGFELKLSAEPLLDKIKREEIK